MGLELDIADLKYEKDNNARRKKANTEIEKLDTAKNFANKIWNVSKFVLMNLEDYELKKDSLQYTIEDKWILKWKGTAIGDYIGPSTPLNTNEMRKDTFRWEPIDVLLKKKTAFQKISLINGHVEFIKELLLFLCALLFKKFLFSLSIELFFI